MELNIFSKIRFVGEKVNNNGANGCYLTNIKMGLNVVNAPSLSFSAGSLMQGTTNKFVSVPNGKSAAACLPLLLLTFYFDKTVLTDSTAVARFFYLKVF